ncbi:MAG: hypothetical protein NZM31_12570 [Gemmatales bacterium]|nr:hypothetical protein [Gemmatales bacterium]MDW8387829.1 hypothetical protein [Gemmatales bacterium]
MRTEAPLFLLAAATSGAVLFIGALEGLLLGSRGRVGLTVLRRAVGVLGVLVACHHFGSWVFAPWASLAGSIAAATWAITTERLRPKPRGIAFIILGALSGLGLIYQADHAATDLPKPALPRQDLLFTDAGNPVFCFLTAEPNPWIDLATKRCEKEFSGSLMRVAAPHVGYSCHGWTFAAGRCHIPGDEVPKILRDNGYRQVTEPQVGDVIAYLDDVGRVLHTGIVRYRGPDGMVLVESKWDLLGRYLHRPEAQPYSDRFAFYRTLRPNHTLRGVASLPPRQNETSVNLSHLPCSHPCPAEVQEKKELHVAEGFRR